MSSLTDSKSLLSLLYCLASAEIGRRNTVFLHDSPYSLIHYWTKRLTLAVRFRLSSALLSSSPSTRVPPFDRRTTSPVCSASARRVACANAASIAERRSRNAAPYASCTYFRRRRPPSNNIVQDDVERTTEKH